MNALFDKFVRLVVLCAWTLAMACPQALSQSSGESGGASLVIAAETQVQGASAPPATKAVSATNQEKADSEKRFSGNVSWYGIKFQGRRTASGRPFNMNELTAAHRTLPFGTRVLIENPKNGKSVIVEITDRGPFSSRRVMDVSREAARQLGVLLGGVAYLDCLVLGRTAAPGSGGRYTK